MESVAIIGMGTSGMAVAAAYEKEAKKGTYSIDCYDREDSFGKGYPYRTDTKDLILNLKTRKISYNYQDNDDLAHWLEDQKQSIPVYTPRTVFGEYTKSRLMDTLNSIGANIIQQQVAALDYDAATKEWHLTTEKGEKRTYQRVHLCCGEISQKNPYQLKGQPKVIHKVYPMAEKLRGITSDHRVCIIGAGLTAVDIATHLIKNSKAKKIHMFSNTNVVPTVRVEPVDITVSVLTLERVQAEIEKGGGSMSFEVFDELFTQELREQGIHYESFLAKHMVGGIEGLKTNIQEPNDLAIVQALLPPLNVVFNLIWNAMPEASRESFILKYHPFMCLNRSPVPMESAELMIEAAERGQLDFLQGVDHVSSDEKALIHLQDGSSMSVDVIINGTGLDPSLKDIHLENPLLASLLDKRILQRDRWGGITTRFEDMAVISPRYGTLENLHAYGILVTGIQYRNNSTLIIQMTAHNLLKNLSKRVYA